MRIVAGHATGSFTAVWLTVAIVFAATIVSPTGTTAHEPRTTGNGNYTLTVGFLNEPAYVGLENGLYINVVQIGGSNDPVSDLQDSLRADVTFGGSQTLLTLTPIPDAPGEYVGRFIPTRAGDYTFLITGTIGEETISEEFRSSPDTFDSVQPASLVQFLEAVPAGSDLTTALDEADDDVTGARTLALVGIGVGLLGVLLSLVAIGLITRRRPT